MSKKVQQQRYGDADVLEVVEVSTPSDGDLAADHVLVKVAFAGLNPVDWKARAGGAYAGMLGEPPFTVGWDLAGTVTAIGSAVTSVSIGERVAAFSNFPAQAAAYAQYAVVAADQLVSVPGTVTDEAAAALPLAALTAWQALFDRAGLARGQRVLVQGAGGGVGHLAVQIAHHIGAYVIATASAGKHAWLINLGADEVIDYTTRDVVESLAGSPVDVVLDLIGGIAGPQSVAVTKPGGVVVEISEGDYVDDATRTAAAAVGVRVEGYSVHIDRDQLAQVMNLAGRGVLTPTVSEIFDLADVAKAHRALESGHTRGKILLKAW
jgi:NADPH:quinone reductase-like Zn-dependent oxidoreductase